MLTIDGLLLNLVEDGHGFLRRSSSGWLTSWVICER